MKAVVIVFLFIVSSVNGFAQGTVNFINIVGALNAPDFDWDGTTRISGPQYRVRLLAGTNPVVLVPVTTTGFHTNAPGYFDGGVVTITNIPPGGWTYLQIQVWNTEIGATPEEAKACGCIGTYAQSAVLSLWTGNPLATPPGLPAPLSGLTSITLNALSPPNVPPILGTYYTETNTLSLTWGSLYYRAVLQQSPDLTATSWTDVTNVPQIVNYRSQVTVPASSAKMFYRLINR